MFRIPQLRRGFAIQGLQGAAMMCVIYYVLLYLQVARGISSSAAGLYLIPMAVGMTAVGLLSGRLAERGWSARTFTVSGTLTSALAFGLLATIATDTSLWLVRAGLLLAGTGFGQLIGQLIQLVQDAAPRHQLGVATTGIRFFQTLGNALGSAVFGTLLLRLYAADGPGGEVSAIAGLTGGPHGEAVRAFVSATNVVFLCGAG
ncbi:MFS transporter [Streptomyces sp. NPDC059009]|uniref:MFS transporter n=1 Tax=Streptomyces sp. NPDC059009 TaxID=3346694 RepID=UPI0036AB2F8B